MSNRLLIYAVVALWIVNVWVLWQIKTKAESVDSALSPVRNFVNTFIK